MGIPDRRERERAARRRAILDAAQRVLLERGLTATTMEEVASAAELSKGALYLYFDNKDTLCAAIAERCLCELLPRLREGMGAEGSGLGSLRRAFELYEAFFRGQPQVFRMALSWVLEGVQSPDQSEQLQAYRDRIGELQGLAMEAIEQGKRDGSVRADIEPLPAAMQMWGGFLGVMLFELSPQDMHRRLPNPIDVDQLVPQYVENALRGLQGPAATEADRRWTGAVPSDESASSDTSHGGAR